MNNTVKKGAPVRVKWDLIDGDWKAGIKSMQTIADAYEEATGKRITPAGIKKHYDELGIPRDLSGKIKAKAVLQKDELDPLDKSGFVYVIYIDDSAEERYFKIGMASSFNIRFGSHQCVSPFDICVACVYFVPNMRVEERILHTMFAEKKVRGEWFKLDTNDLRVIASRSLIL